MFLSRGKHESFSLKLIRTRSRDPVTGTNNYIRNNKNPLIRKFEEMSENNFTNRLDFTFWHSIEEILFYGILFRKEFQRNESIETERF